MNLAIDIGNSGIKTGIFSKNKLERVKNISSVSEFKWEKYAEKNKINNAIICSVGADSGKGIIKELLSLSKVLYFNEMTRVPIKNNYKSPKTLGKDRLAVAVAAAAIFPKTHVLVIQVGTCVTFDFVNAKKEYLGGAISPGLLMRFKALHTFTDKLPLVKPIKINYRLGTNTQQSILSGVINGMRDELDSAIEDYQKRYKKLKVVLTGGDSYFFETQLKNEIFAQPNLVLYGLNQIMDYNA